MAKFPLKTGQRWQWKLDDIDDRWSDSRLVEYHGKVAATYEYSVSGQETVRTPLGSLKCSVIKAWAKSRLVTSSLKSYFDRRFGFVRLECLNLDGSSLTVNLVEVQEP
jgi:hypothetical protein